VRKVTGSGRGLSWSALCRLAKKLPGVEEGSSYGTPALRVRKKLLARLKKDGKTIALRVDVLERDLLLESDSKAFLLTDHYRPYPFVLVCLQHVRLDVVEELLEQAWRSQAPKRLVDTLGAFASNRLDEAGPVVSRRRVHK
jgi:hypothetical protein